MLRVLLLLGYPPLAHLSVLTGSHTLTCIALIWLGIAVLYPGLRAGRRTVWLGLSAFAASAVALSLTGDGLWLMVALSLALPGVVLAAFALSLRHGRTPAITAIATKLHDPLPPEIVTYTRHLTVFWTFVIALLMLGELALVMTGDARAWSRYANGYVYLFLAAVFALEYGYRRLRYRKLPHPELGRYLSELLHPHRPGLT